MKKISDTSRVWIFLSAILYYGSANAATGLDVGDLWWNPKEAGWGMQLVQQSTTVFATLFVYDQNKVAVWYSATLPFTGTNVQGGPIYSGDLYKTVGPWLGAAMFDPTAVQLTKVGTLTFDSATTANATVSYTVNGTSVTKTVTRQTIAVDNYNGVFAGAYEIQQTACSNPSNNGVFAIPTIFSVSQNGSAMAISMSAFSTSFSRDCSFNGTFTQTGRIGNYRGSYSCSTGETGNVVLAEMAAERFAIMGRIASGTNNFGCTLAGHFAAVQ